MSSRTMQLCYLDYGQSFKIPNSENSFKNLKLVRCNDCSAVVAGDRRIEINGKKIWAQIPAGFTISPYTVVEVT